MWKLLRHFNYLNDAMRFVCLKKVINLFLETVSGSDENS